MDLRVEVGDRVEASAAEEADAVSHGLEDAPHALDPAVLTLGVAVLALHEDGGAVGVDRLA